MLILNQDMSDDQIVDLLNEEIDKRRSFGRREEIVPKGVKARRIFWRDPVLKNGSSTEYIDGKWNGVDYYVTKGGEMIRADANVLIVGNLPNRLVSKKGGYSCLISEISDRLDPLPLAKSSFQSKRMGKFDLVDIDPPSGVLAHLDDQENEDAMIHKIRMESGQDDFAEEWDKKLGGEEDKEKTWQDILEEGGFERK